MTLGTHLFVVPPATVAHAWRRRRLDDRWPISHERRSHNATLIASQSTNDGNEDRAILTVDIGTSSIKSALFFPFHGEQSIGPVFRHTLKTTSCHNFQVTQRPEDWFIGTVQTFRDALSAHPQAAVVAVSVTGQMQDLIAVGDGRPDILHTDAILYSDCRAQEEAQALSNVLDTPVLSTSLLAKLKLLSQPPSTTDAPRPYNLALGAADYITFSLCESRAQTFTDATTVSTTGLSVAPGHRQYDDALLHAAGLSPFLPYLPVILDKPRVVGKFCPLVAERTGLSQLSGVDVVHAGGDAFSATVGAGCAGLGGGAYIYAGTSGWIAESVGVRDARADDNVDVEGGVFRLGHAADECCNILASSVMSVGASLRVACNTFLQCDVCDLDGEAAGSVVGANGIVYVPYVNGRRCPAPRDVTVGGLYGVAEQSTKSDIARGVIEGVLFSVVQAAQAIPRPVGRLLVAGGVAKCETFVSGIAALLGDVEVCPLEVGLLGAGSVAAQAVELAPTKHSGGTHSFHNQVWMRASESASESERSSWTVAFRRWKKVVKGVECLWDVTLNF